MIVGNWRAPSKNARAQAYVTVSRLKTRFGLAVMKEFSDDDALYFVPPANTLEEDVRLQQLSDQFVHRFRQS